MILVVCPNPAIDRTILVPELARGEVNRGQLVSSMAGGKGFNVARALRSLGVDATVVGVAGGKVGADLLQLAHAERLDCELTESGGETRICTILTDGKGLDTVINEAGPTVAASRWEQFCQAVQRRSRDADLAVICGSLPRVERPDPLSPLVAAFGTVPWWVDTSGDALAAAAALGPAGIKVNESEAAGLERPAGTTLVVTFGASGASVETDSGRWHAPAPRPRVVRSAVGAGDSFMAGWLANLDLGTVRALSLAVAVGSDAVGRLGGGVIDAVEAKRMQENVVVERVPAR